MKLKNIFSRAALVFAIVFTLNACEKDSSTEPTSDDRNKFLGAWLGTSTGSTGTRNFNMNFTASNSSSDQILMSNFDGEGANTFVSATVDGNSFSINRTIVNGDTIQGSGSYSSGNLSFNFTVRDGQTVDSRTGSAHR